MGVFGKRGPSVSLFLPSPLLILLFMRHAATTFPLLAYHEVLTCLWSALTPASLPGACLGPCLPGLSWSGCTEGASRIARSCMWCIGSPVICCWCPSPLDCSPVWCITSSRRDPVSLSEPRRATGLPCLTVMKGAEIGIVFTRRQLVLQLCGSRGKFHGCPFAVWHGVAFASSSSDKVFDLLGSVVQVMIYVCFSSIEAQI